MKYPIGTIFIMSSIFRKISGYSGDLYFTEVKLVDVKSDRFTPSSFSWTENELSKYPILSPVLQELEDV